MRPSILLGLELPPLDAGPGGLDDRAVLSVVEVAQLAEEAGVGTLWLAGAEPGGLDAGPLAGAVAVATERVGIGIVDRPHLGRHPSMLAREATTVDLLSEGRAVVGVLGEDPSAPDAHRVIETAALLHRLFTEHGVTAAGRFYEVEQLTTRPRPARVEGPPVVAGWGRPTPSAGLDAMAALVAAGADAVLTGGAPSDVARARRRMGPATESNGRLLWRGELPGPMGDAAGLAESVLAEGADGLVAVVPATLARGGRLAAGPLEGLLGLLRSLVGRLEE